MRTYITFNKLCTTIMITVKNVSMIVLLEITDIICEINTVESLRHTSAY